MACQTDLDGTEVTDLLWTYCNRSGFSCIRALMGKSDTSVVLTAKQTSDKTNAEMYAAGFSRLFDAGMQEYMINVSSVEQ